MKFLNDVGINVWLLKVVAALTNKVQQRRYLNFCGVQMNDKIMRTSFSPGLLTLSLFPQKSQTRHQVMLGRLAKHVLI